jgi:F0F1-type ATP synthase membrane subunit b/b'
MENEFKEMIERSKKSLENVEEKIEDLSEEFAEDVSEFWGNLKGHFAKVNDKLKDAYEEIDSGETKLQAHLSMMEARDRLEKVRKSAEDFAITASNKTKEEYSMASLQAHLAKMEAEDKWEEAKKELTEKYNASKVDVEALSKKAVHEINEVFEKLTRLV